MIHLSIYLPHSLLFSPSLPLSLFVHNSHSLSPSLQVLPGQQIPCDGAIVFGRTTVNEAMLTGEAMPVSKSEGDTLFGGTINQTGVCVCVCVVWEGEGERRGYGGRGIEKM